MRRRILLADDSVTIQKVIELTFLDEDYEVKAVSNGDEAIAALPQVSPDFVIADVHMPGANGYEVCRRSKEMRPEVPVLLLVGTFEPFDEGQSRAVGADSFLKKPFDSQELLQRVEDLLAARSGAGLSTAAPAAVSPPPSNDDFLAMPALSELPPIDLGPAPSPFAAPPPPATDWGSFQLEPTVDATPEPADPFPASDPFPAVDPFSEPAPFPAPAPYPARAESPFDDSPFQLDAEPSAGDALQVDEGALLPAGEPLFELDSHLGTEPDAIEDFEGTGGLRAGEFGDAAPALETPSFDSYDSPSFETPSFETPSFETPSYQPPSFEQPSYTASSFETPSFETPSFEPPPLPLGFATTPEERLGVPQGAVPLVESRAEMEARIEAPPPPSIEASHEPESTMPATAAPAPLTVGTVTPAAPPASVNGGGRLSDEDVDRIARRVVELMADKAIRDVAWEVIPDMAEVVIRDRLRELESQAESFE